MPAAEPARRRPSVASLRGLTHGGIPIRRRHVDRPAPRRAGPGRAGGSTFTNEASTDDAHTVSKRTWSWSMHHEQSKLAARRHRRTHLDTATWSEPQVRLRLRSLGKQRERVVEPSSKGAMATDPHIRSKIALDPPGNIQWMQS